MEVIVGKTAGFCFGVKNAVECTKAELEKNKNIYCLGELVHNKQVIEELEDMGLRTIEDISEVQADAQVIIRAHGVPPKVYKYAKEHNIKITDLTCPKVAQIHKYAKEYANNGYYIILLGEKTHPETIGTKGFCGQDVYVAQEISEIPSAINAYKNSNKSKIVLLVQTTFSVVKFDEISKELQKHINNIEIKNTICNSTRTRQDETEVISKQVDCMIIIGGKNSANTKKLYDIACNNCKYAILIQTSKELNMQEIQKYEKIGVTAGASTPSKSIQDVINVINKKEGLC